MLCVYILPATSYTPHGVGIGKSLVTLAESRALEND